MSDQRKVAAWISFVIGVLVLGIKFWAYWMTRSQAIFSDALESIVNVVAAAIGIAVIRLASKPADKDHPYGHGKIEFFSAAFEGGLITFAAIVICVEIAKSATSGSEIRELDSGLIISAVAGLINLVLGLYLKNVGTKQSSIALKASGQHLISDFLTTVAVVVGIFLIKFTGLLWIDSVVAGVIAIQLGFTGLRLVSTSVGGLMDAEDKSLIGQIGALFDKHLISGIIRIHHTRVIRSGRYYHVDAHVVVPEFWNVMTAHDETQRFSQQIFNSNSFEGEFHFHIDPCQRAYCRACDLENCPVRAIPFEKRIPFSLEELVDPKEPQEFINSKR